jgi:transcriptional regulator with XRE-family HTH domain
MQINKILKTIRTKKNLRQEDIAKIIGIQSNTYSDWERGRTQKIAFEDIEKIANICDFEILFQNKYTKEIITSKNIDRKEI